MQLASHKISKNCCEQHEGCAGGSTGLPPSTPLNGCLLNKHFIPFSLPLLYHPNYINFIYSHGNFFFIRHLQANYLKANALFCINFRVSRAYCNIISKFITLSLALNFANCFYFKLKCHCLATTTTIL